MFCVSVHYASLGTPDVNFDLVSMGFARYKLCNRTIRTIEDILGWHSLPFNGLVLGPSAQLCVNTFPLCACTYVHKGVYGGIEYRAWGVSCSEWVVCWDFGRWLVEDAYSWFGWPFKAWGELCWCNIDSCCFCGLPSPHGAGDSECEGSLNWWPVCASLTKQAQDHNSKQLLY